MTVRVADRNESDVLRGTAAQSPPRAGSGRAAGVCLRARQRDKRGPRAGGTRAPGRTCRSTSAATF